jgi:hypothetical protein
VVNFCYSLKTYLRKKMEFNKKLFACKMCLSPKNCHFCEKNLNGGKKRKKK